MATFDNSAFLGNRNVRPTEAQLTNAEQWERGLGDSAIMRLWRHLGYFTHYMAIYTAINDNAVSSAAWAPRNPIKVVGFDAACESAAGTTMVVDLQYKVVGGSFASMLEAPIDVKTGAGVFQNALITDGEEDVAYLTQLKLIGTAVDAGAVVGTQGILHCIRL